LTGPRHLRSPDHVVDYVPSSHGLPAAVLITFYIINFADLYGRGVPVLLQPEGDALDLTPPVGVVASHQDLLGAHDKVGPDGPFATVVEFPDGGQVRRITFRRAIIRPSGDHRDLVVVEGGVLLVLLNADVLLDVPGRHRTGTITDRGALLDPPGEAPRLLVRDERHGSDAHRVVAILATPLQNRRDVPVERHVFRIKSGIGGGSEGLCPERKWRHEEERGRENQNPPDRVLPPEIHSATHHFHSDCGRPLGAPRENSTQALTIVEKPGVRQKGEGRKTAGRAVARPAA